jgi:hypothetical protein
MQFTTLKVSITSPLKKQKTIYPKKKNNKTSFLPITKSILYKLY